MRSVLSPCHNNATPDSDCTPQQRIVYEVLIIPIDAKLNTLYMDNMIYFLLFYWRRYQRVTCMAGGTAAPLEVITSGITLGPLYARTYLRYVGPPDDA